MGEDVASNFTLAALDNLDVCFHASERKVLGEQVGDVSVRVETTKLERKN